VAKVSVIIRNCAWPCIVVGGLTANEAVLGRGGTAHTFDVQMHDVLERLYRKIEELHLIVAGGLYVTVVFWNCV
jgi:hypothetical protein